MTRAIVSVFAIAALLLLVDTALRPQASVVPLSAGTAAMPSLEELHRMAGVRNLSDQEIDDQALIYSSELKR
jgi:hypothetical protein